MVSIAWVVLCEGIYKDQTDRMSLLGIASHMPVPSLPLVLTEHVLVARLSHHDVPEELDIAFGVVTPAGLWVTPNDVDAACVSISGDYVIITLRSLPLRDEGIHRFEVGLGNGASASVEIPVWLCYPQLEQSHVH